MEIDIDFVGLEEVDNKVVYHIFIPNPYYSMEINSVGNTNQLSIRQFNCGYKGCVENAAEETRIGINANAPSRFKCLFVCNEQSVRHWYNHFVKRNKILRPTIYELEVTGKIFWSYAELLQSVVYWNPNILSNLQEYEGVFEGEYQVIRKRDIDDF